MKSEPKFQIYVVCHGWFGKDEYKEFDTKYFDTIEKAQNLMTEASETFDNVQWIKNDNLWAFKVPFQTYTERWWIDVRNVY